MNRKLPIVALLALLTANAAGAVENPDDMFSPQTIGRTAVMIDGDQVVVDINATPSAATVKDGKMEIDLAIGTKQGVFVQSQLGANAAFKRSLDETNELFSKITPGDRSIDSTTAFRTVGVIDASYETRIGFSYKDLVDEAKFVSLEGMIAMEQTGKFVALLTEDGSQVKYFNAELLADALANYDGEAQSLDEDALATLGVSESFSITVGAEGGRKMAKKVSDGGRKHTLQIIDRRGAIIASIDQDHHVTIYDATTAPAEYDVAQQSGRTNAKLKYNVKKDVAELAEPLEIAA